MRNHLVLGSLAALLAILTITACNSGGSGPTAPPDPTTPVATGGASVGSTEIADYASIDIEKSTNGVDADTPPGPSIPVGQTVTWSYRITNNGNETLIGISATDSDPMIGALTCPDTTLDPGEFMSCDDESGTAELGQYMNTATVNATTDPGGDPVEDSDDSHYFGIEGGSVIALDISKKTNGEDADSAPGPIVLVGEAVEWTYTVTNNSEGAASSITVTDDQEGSVTCPSSELGPGESMDCTAIMGTAEPGQYENVATLEAMVDSEMVTVSDTSHYFGSDPSVSIDKRTNGDDGLELVIGCEVTWTYEITNDGNIDLENIVVTDDQLGPITCPDTMLAVGDSMTCEVTGTVEEGPYQNEGTVTADDIVGNPAEPATDQSSYIGTSSCTEIVPDPDELWPPNHRFQTVEMTGAVCGGSGTIVVTAVTQDEPVNGTGDGDTSPDAVIDGDETVRIRSERAGGGNGRVYGISYDATSSGGVTCDGIAYVGVPHDQSGSPAIDDGQNYDSTQEF